MLRIFHDSVEISKQQEFYQRLSNTLTITTTKPLYVGYHKPISDLYFELSVASQTALALGVEYWNGTNFAVISSVKDETLGLAVPGFISWDRTLISEKATTLNNLELFWYKFTVSISANATIFKGINCILSNDYDLIQEYPNISSDFLPTGQTSFIRFHEATRDEIIQEIRNKGNVVGASQALSKKIDVFDLLDISEFRQTAKFLALSKIMFWLSDAVDDKWFQKGKKYYENYKDSFNLAYLSIDFDDDGKIDVEEKNAWNQCRLNRV